MPVYVKITREYEATKINSLKEIVEASRGLHTSDGNRVSVDSARNALAGGKLEIFELSANDINMIDAGENCKKEWLYQIHKI
ncbi:hypothetical protein [Vibrio crassostreae]|uniref:hypothetical protein n=1 Tax=Vibrio crassostreae TaxID=246167 RepID=UPI001B30AF80|nr:hypothetical protein [Vibrio crassostreae]